MRKVNVGMVLVLALHLALLAGMFCFGLSPAMAMHHQEGEHHGPPPVPPEMVEILEDLLEGGDLSGAAATMLGHLLMTPEEREDTGESEIPEEEQEAAKEEIAEIFGALLEEEIPKPAEIFIHVILRQMESPLGPPPGFGAENAAKRREERQAEREERQAERARAREDRQGTRDAKLREFQEAEERRQAERAEQRRLAEEAEEQRRLAEEAEEQRRLEEEDEDEDVAEAAGDGGGFSDEHFEAALLFCHDVFQVLYPTAKAILNDGIADDGRTHGATGLKKFNVDPTSAKSILGNLTLAIHETGHGLDGELKRTDGRENYFLVAAEPSGALIEFTPPGLTTPNSSDYFQGISRSAILLDTQNYKRPPDGCVACILSPHDGDGEWGSDGSYSNLYLNGAPEEGVITHYKEGFSAYDPGFTAPSNNSFDSGDQGYGMLFEETVQYSHSLAWMYYTHEPNSRASTSGKTGMLQWLWWNQRYLKLIREEYPDEHAFFVEHWAEAFLTVWGQSWRYLDTPTMSYQEDKYDHLLELVTDDLMLGEVQYVREMYGGGASTRGSELADASLNSDPDGNTWAGPQLSGPPLIVDSGSIDGDYYTTMPEGFFEPEDFPDLTEYIEKYDARLSLEEGGYGNTD